MPKIAIIAGEASGDDIGSIIMQEIIKMMPNAVFYGVGGIKMQKMGLHSHFDYHMLHKIGIIEIIPHIVVLNRLINSTADYINALQPDILITIDAPGFCKRVAKKIDKNITKCHIVAPSVWAWRPKRRFEFAKIYDKLCCLLPFEPPYFADTRLSAVYVGHPLCDTIKLDKKRYKNPQQILVLCGSRPSEIAYNAPYIRQIQDIILADNPDIRFVSVVSEKLHQNVKAILQPKTEIYMNHINKYTLFQESSRALAVSGTVCLELALCNVPTIMIYKVHALTYQILRRLMKIKKFSLVNIITGLDYQPEYIQHNIDVKKIAQQLNAKEFYESPRQQNIAQSVLSAFGNQHFAVNIGHVINELMPKDKR